MWSDICPSCKGYEGQDKCTCAVVFEDEPVPKPTAPERPSNKMADVVNHPEHYTQGGIECIDAIQAALTPEEFRGYCKGNAMKYIWRERLKGGAESLSKAQWYLDRLEES